MSIIKTFVYKKVSEEMKTAIGCRYLDHTIIVTNNVLADSSVLDSISRRMAPQCYDAVAIAAGDLMPDGGAHRS